MKNLFLIVGFIYSLSSMAMFQTSECVGYSFQGKLSIEKGPFGVFPLSMSVKKNRCIVDIERDQLMKSSWQIDLCREPVHIKIKSWSGEKFSLRKNYPCREDEDYCKQVDDLFDALSNEALIYAKGERETINTDHGKFYCSYLLLKQYLMEGRVFSLTVPASINIFEKTPLESFGAEEKSNAVLTPTPTPAPNASQTAAPAASKGTVKF